MVGVIHERLAEAPGSRRSTAEAVGQYSSVAGDESPGRVASTVILLFRRSFPRWFLRLVSSTGIAGWLRGSPH